MRSLLVGVLVVASALGGCVATAQFHSKNGQAYPMATQRAVQCNPQEAHMVVAAGGMVIGTIDGQGMTANATVADVADKAAQVAGESGGTHIVLTSEGTAVYESTTPETVDKQCVQTEDGHECQTTYHPATTTTVEKPTAQFIVLRLPAEMWNRLPPALQPGLPPH